MSRDEFYQLAMIHAPITLRDALQSLGLVGDEAEGANLVTFEELWEELAKLRAAYAAELLRRWEHEADDLRPDVPPEPPHTEYTGPRPPTSR